MFRCDRFARGRGAIYRVLTALALGLHLALGAVCTGAERRLSPAEAKTIAKRYIAGTGRLLELLDGVQAEGHYSFISGTQGDPKTRMERQSRVKYLVSGKKIKSMQTAVVVNGKAHPEISGVFIYNGNTSYAAQLNKDGRYSLTQRGSRDAREEQMRMHHIYMFVRCPVSLGSFYIPSLISSADYKFRIGDVDELGSPGTNPAYKIHIHMKFRPSNAEYTGWLIADPRRNWAVTEFELTNESQGFRKTISGGVKYSASAEQPHRPLSASLVDLTKITTREDGANKAATGTRVVETRQAVVFDRYEFRKVPDSEFSLSSIGLASAELPPGYKGNRLTYILGLCSIVSSMGALAIAYYLRRSGRA
jgi:hypothetical protein